MIKITTIWNDILTNRTGTRGAFYQTLNFVIELPEQDLEIGLSKEHK